MNIENISTLTYIVKTRFCNNNNTFQETEFSSDNSLDARRQAIQFMENYLEIIANEGLLKLSSELLNPKAIHRVNRILSKPDAENYTKIKLFNNEAISIIPQNTIFPAGISLSFKISSDCNEENEYEILSYQKVKHSNFEKQLNNLILEHQCLENLNIDLSENEIELDKSQFVTLNLVQDEFKILETPFSWSEKSRQFQIDHLYDKDSMINGLYERLFNYESYDYVNFLETNNLDEIEKIVYALFHGRGGLIYVGYHPENLIESILSDVEVLDYIDYLNHVFSQDKYLYKNVKFEIFNYNDFPVLAIIVLPLNEASKQLHAYDPNKVFVRQNNMILKIEDI